MRSYLLFIFCLINFFHLTASKPQSYCYRWDFEDPPSVPDTSQHKAPTLYLSQNKGGLYSYQLPSLQFINKRTAVMNADEVFINDDNSISVLNSEQPVLKTSNTHYTVEKFFSPFFYQPKNGTDEEREACWEEAIRNTNHESAATPLLFLCFSTDLPDTVRTHSAQTSFSRKHIQNAIQAIKRHCKETIEQEKPKKTGKKRQAPQAAEPRSKNLKQEPFDKVAQDSKENKLQSVRQQNDYKPLPKEQHDAAYPTPNSTHVPAKDSLESNKTITVEEKLEPTEQQNSRKPATLEEVLAELRAHDPSYHTLSQKKLHDAQGAIIEDQDVLSFYVPTHLAQITKDPEQKKQYLIKRQQYEALIAANNI